MKIGFRMILAIALIFGIGLEFKSPEENSFRSFTRIILWSIFLVMQVDYLIKKFRNAGMRQGPAKQED